MGRLVAFLGASPARLQAVAIAALVAAVAALSLLVFGLYWRGEAYQTRGERDVAIAQAKVLAQGIEACTAGVTAAERAAAASIAAGRKLLADAERVHAGASAQIAVLEKLLAGKPPVRKDGTPAGCDDAWNEIEKG